MTNPEVSVVWSGILWRVWTTSRNFYELGDNQILVVIGLSALSPDEVSVDGNER